MARIYDPRKARIYDPRKARNRLLVALALCVALTAPASATASVAPPGVDDLERDIDKILTDPRLSGARAGVVVRSETSGEELYNRDGNRLFMPASNEKLVTSAAAMELLGPDHRFTTDALATGRRGSSVRNLYLRGTGDPTMLAESIDDLAREVAANGVKRVRGRLIADDTWFDGVRLGRDWANDDEPFSYAAQVSALTASPDPDFDAGAVIVSVAPGTPGSRPKASLTPSTGHVRIVNKAETGGSSTDLSVTRTHGTNDIVITGNIAADADPVTRFMAVDDPTGYATDLFKRALSKHGVRVSRLGRGATPSGADRLAHRRSKPLGKLLVEFMKLSNNLIAEILVKSLGRETANEGSWAAGVTAVTDFLNKNGVDTSVIRQVDGSGLSRLDGLTPDQTAALLANLRAKPWFDTWHNALPIAGEADRLVGGTLRSRMRDTAAEGNVHAKTGSLTSVTALSGYVTSADEEKLIFSIMFNMHLSPNPKDLEDAIAVRLAEFSRDRPAEVRLRAPEKSRTVDPGDARDPGTLECSWLKDC